MTRGRLKGAQLTLQQLRYTERTPHTLTADIVATLARSVKTCVLRLSPTKVCFILSDRVPVGGANLWCEILQQNLFDEYRIEGKDERNEIYLEVVMEQLSRALKSALNATVVKLKLTKKQGACFTVEITQPTLTGALRGVTHDVPVTVVPVRLWADYQEPSMPDIDVSIFLPPLRLFKSVIDRMKALSNYVTISANMSGELHVSLETDTVTATTYFKDLKINQFQDTSMVQDDQRSQDTLTLHEARVDVRKLSQFLQGQFIPTKVICNVVNNKGIQIFLLHDVVSIQHYIPAVAR